jgi:hypothetical protein
MRASKSTSDKIKTLHRSLYPCRKVLYMNTRLIRLSSILGILSLAALTQAFAQDATIDAKEASAKHGAVAAKVMNFDSTIQQKSKWYFSWGFSRQQYAPSDIHVSQPELGNDFTVHKVEASDFPTSPAKTLSSLVDMDITNPQNNFRIGKFLNPEQSFAIELNVDHSKYNNNLGQVARVSGTINGQPVDSHRVLDEQTFNYTLHNGLNHIMVNAVWLKHLWGPEKQAGSLQLISRAGAGILLPHAEVVIFGKATEVGPKNENICCFKKNDWWQLNGWTAGVEVGGRYTIYKSIYLELTTKLAYGVLRGVPVYKGSADQTIWMSEQVLSAGFVF